MYRLEFASHLVKVRVLLGLMALNGNGIRGVTISDTWFLAIDAWE